MCTCCPAETVAQVSVAKTNSYIPIFKKENKQTRELNVRCPDYLLSTSLSQSSFNYIIRLSFVLLFANKKKGGVRIQLYWPLNKGKRYYRKQEAASFNKYLLFHLYI